MRDLAETLRRRQRDWLAEIMARFGIKPTPLAKAAGVAVTTITRKLNDPDDTAILSDLTVARICDYLKIAPPNFLSDDPPNLSGLREQEAEPYVAGAADPLMAAIQALTSRPGVDPWRIKGRALEYEGYRPGDIAIVDLNATPRQGDIVCAQIYDWSQPNNTQTVFRRLEPPFLVGAGPEDAARKPRFIDNEAVIIKGVVVASLRVRPARAA
jgi:hypothetical protein